MNASLLRFLLEHEMRIALQTADEFFPIETPEEICKCLKLGRYNRITDDSELKEVVSLDAVI
jgi:hypothetical protein